MPLPQDTAFQDTALASNPPLLVPDEPSSVRSPLTVDSSVSVPSQAQANPSKTSVKEACDDRNDSDTSFADHGHARTQVWGVPFDCVTMEQSVHRIEQLIQLGRPSYVITANVNYVMLHYADEAMPPITQAADLILADGQPIVWRSRLQQGPPLPERVAGSELIYHLARLASQRQWGIYFLGGQPGVAAQCAGALKQQYPGMPIAGIESPPYRPLSESEQRAQDERIRVSGAKMLLVAFGQPKGEKWIHQHYQRLGVPVSIQLGASFDFIAGNAKRAPKIWQRLGMEWAYRMCSDPKRLIPRYAANARFLLSRFWA